MTHPLDIPRYIQLATDQPLERATIAAWYRCVRQYAPSGTVIGRHAQDDKKSPTTVQLVHRITDSRHCYLVPLARNLRAAEVDRIVQAFATEVPDLDFEVETNETKLMAQEHGGLALDAAQHLALCLALAKQQHEDWVRDRSDNGWRYGVKFSRSEKTDPLMRPWDQIPERFRKPDLNLPQTMLNLLSNHGYAVLPSKDLERLLRKAT